MRKTILSLIAFFVALVIAVPAAHAGNPTVTGLAGFNTDDYNGGTVNVIAIVSDAMPFTTVYFEYYTTDDDVWVPLGKDEDGSDGYSFAWNTGDLNDFGAGIKAYADTVGTVTDEFIDYLSVVNIVPNSISGYTNPDEGTLDLTVNVVSPYLQSYFPPNPWGITSNYSYFYSYTVVNNDPDNESKFAGTVDQFATWFSTGGYNNSNGYWVGKLFQLLDDGTINHIWSSSNQTTWTRGTESIMNVNVPNVPIKTQTGVYYYSGYVYSASYTGNPTGAYYIRQNVSSDGNVSSWYVNSSYCAPVRARLMRQIEPTEQVQVGYSLDGGQTFTVFADATSVSSTAWSASLDSLSLGGGLASENFVLGARAHNGSVWCSWYATDPFVLTNDVDVVVTTSLGNNGEVTVDGGDPTARYEATWKYFATHAVEAPMYLSEVTNNNRRVFSNWSDGGARVHDAKVNDNTESTLTAYYDREYYLTVNSSQYYLTGDESGYYLSGTSIYILAEAVHSIDKYNRYACTGWYSPQLGSSTDNEALFNITTATTITFNWELEFLFEVRNDLYSATGDVGGWYAKNSVMTSSVPNFVQAGIGVRYRCVGYKGTGSLTLGATNSTGSFAMTMPTSVTWEWIVQYELTVESNTGLPVGGGWYDSGAEVEVNIVDNADPNWERNTFLGWSGTGEGSVTSNSLPVAVTVTMDGPIRQFANYMIEYYLSLDTIGELGGFVEDISGWYERGTIVTVDLSEPDKTEIIRYMPEWRGTGEGSVNLTKSIDNPKQAVFTMNNPIEQLVEWFPQYRVDVLNPTGNGVVSPVVGYYWYFAGEEVAYRCSVSDGDLYCSGFSGTGDFVSNTTTLASAVITQHSTVTWLWSDQPPVPVQYWHPGEAITSEMNSRAIDMMMIEGLPFISYYDDNLNSVLLAAKGITQNQTKPEDWSRVLLVSGLGYATSLNMDYFDGVVYVTFTTDDEKVYLLTYENEQTVPLLLAENVGDGTTSVVIVDANGAPHVYYRNGIFGDLVERVFDNELGQWVENLVDTSVSRFDLDGTLNPQTGMPVLAYRKGIFLYSALCSEDGWTVEKATEEGNAGHDLCVLADTAGGVYVSYADISNFRGSQLFSSSGYYGTWSTSLVDTLYGSGYGSSIQLDGYSRPGICHHTQNAVRYSRFNGTEWVTDTVAEDAAFDGPTKVIIKADGRAACLYFMNNVPMFAEAKATEPSDSGTGTGGEDDPGNGGEDDPGDTTTSSGGGGCFVATAAFGSLSASAVTDLTSIRDNNIGASSTGSNIVAVYYQVSPAAASQIKNSESFRALVRRLLP